MIKTLLEYQNIEKEKLELIRTVEQGKTKKELDAATKVISDAKQTLLTLESEAKNTFSLYESINKNLSELFANVNGFNDDHAGKTEEEIQNVLKYLSGLANKIQGYESQLKEMQRRIDERSKRFEETKVSVVRAQGASKTLSAEYEKQKAEIKGKVDSFEKELKAKEKAIDAKLLERYKKKRAGLSFGNYQDVLVSLKSNRCGGCHFELPLSLTHKISTDGYIVCEECGKIIHNS